MSNNLHIREAVLADLPTIVRLLLEDDLGSQREAASGGAVLPSYAAAFAEIEREPNNQVLVAEKEGEIIGTFQLMYLPSLSFQGGKRAQIESVRVAAAWRGQGIGGQMMVWAVAQAQAAGCVMAQLTTNKQRGQARRFYEGLGFVATHEGMKLMLA